MSQVTSPVILDSTGQDIVTQLALISAAIASASSITGNTDTTLSGVLQGANGKVAIMPVDNTPTDNSTNLVSSGGVKTALDAKSNPGQIGYPEWGTTATNNYTAGQYICWNGLLYTANQAIPIGTTLSAETGGNLTVCVGGGFNHVLASLPWKSYFVIEYDNLDNIPLNGYVNISLPAGYTSANTMVIGASIYQGNVSYTETSFMNDPDIKMTYVIRSDNKFRLTKKGQYASGKFTALAIRF